LVANLHHPSLRAKKYSEAEDKWQARVNRGWRPYDGGYPYAGVIRDSAGNLYGTTATGGASGGGVVYKVDTAGQEAVLYSFTFESGSDPRAGVVLDSAGNLYGTTSGGGASGGGVVYKVDDAGQETVLYTFTGGTGGCNPSAGVIRVRQATSTGPLPRVVRRAQVWCTNWIRPASLTALYSSLASCADGGYPSAGVIRDSMGNLYGTTENGGKQGTSVVFKIVP
jgi:uncharacterized repeat protein (TIGR03803 family)